LNFKLSFNFLKRKGLGIAILVYWFLLLYIVVALVFWFIELQNQNHKMTSYKLMELKGDDPDYLDKIEAITKDEHGKTAQYIGEGSFFLLFIMVGAVFIYRAVRKQFKVSQQQQNFMMAITHELKTPIAITKLNLETLHKHKLDEEKQRKLLQMTLQETERLNTLANNILISSQLEAGGYNLLKEELDISSLAAGCVHDFKNRFPVYTWIIDIEDDLALTGDTLLLQIMINNLLENAIKYSPKESTISFTLSKQPHSIVLNVMDEGPGIPDKEKKKIFDRFYRIGNESVRKTKGTGLGLYLCKKIATDHNAIIQVTNNNENGSNFSIHFKV
jgi:two-component system sensor histidine kinase CiaH